MENIKRRNLKKAAKFNLRRNFLACFAICILLTFISSGPLSITDTIETTKNDLIAISETLDIKFMNTGINALSNGLEKVKEATSIGDQSRKGALHSVYSLVSETNNIPQVIRKLVSSIMDGSGASIYVATAISLGMLVFLRLFIIDLMIIGTSRFFLENRLYSKTKISNLLFVYRVKKIWHVALLIAIKYLFLFLWSLTIVGFFIKRYSYYMVPYIVAENPTIPIRDAIRLSRQMMKGYKWHTFVLELSFILWYMLSLLTFGILYYIFLNPYMYATKAELYAALRERAINTKIENSELLDDKYLFELPEAHIEGEEFEEDVYQATSDKLKTGKGRAWLHFTPKPHYSLINLLFMFFIFSFIGWVWECLFEYYKLGIFVNRGTMWGPWVPIYGAGGLMMIIFLNRLASKPFLAFSLGVVIAGIMEYATATVLWHMHHLKYWDYSGYFLNIQGRICLEGLLFFGIMGLSGIYLFAPLSDNLLEKIPLKTRKLIITVLIAAFLTDRTIVSIDPRTGIGITYGDN